MRFVGMARHHASAGTGIGTLSGATRSALWIFDVESQITHDAVVLDGAMVTSMIAVPKMKLRVSASDTAAVADSAARASGDPIARAASLQQADGFGMEFDDDGSAGPGDHDQSLVDTAGPPGDNDEIEQAVADGGGI